jgi:hypothetical protein
VMVTNTVKPEAEYTVEDLFTAYIAYDCRQKPLGGPGHETPEASWKTVLAEARTNAVKGSFFSLVSHLYYCPLLPFILNGAPFGYASIQKVLKLLF